MLTEGVYDKGALKAFITAGGPGSGKSYAVANIFGLPDKSEFQALTGLGLRLYALDIPFVAALKKHGVDPKNLGKMTDKVYDYYTGKFRDKAIKFMVKYLKLLQSQRTGVIVDGTGRDLTKIRRQKQGFEEAGYDVYMLFVNTSLEVALERNRKRDRVLSDEMVEKQWNIVQDNVKMYKREFGSNFIEIDGSKNAYAQLTKQMNKLIDKPVENPIGKAWIEAELKLKNRLKTDVRELNEGDLGQLTDLVKIRVSIADTAHSQERQFRHGPGETITTKEILDTANKAIAPLSQKLMLDELDIGDHVHIFDKSRSLNLVCAIKREGDHFKLVVITVMRKPGFKPYSGTLSIRV